MLINTLNMSEPGFFGFEGLRGNLRYGLVDLAT
jgi:hypothetical protein